MIFDIASNANESSEFLTINALELSALLKEDEHSVQLIDVRQLYERDICHIGGEHIPLSLFEANIAQLSKDKPLVIYCKSGARSATACHMLHIAGFKEVRNLEGGILSWINTIDDRLMKY